MFLFLPAPIITILQLFSFFKVEDKKEECGIKKPLVTTEFFKWSSKYFGQPLKSWDEGDPESKLSMERDYRFQRNAMVRNEAKPEQFKAGKS